MSAGEVSGDVVGSHLACALWDCQPDALIYGLGGSRMAAAGVQIEFETNHLGAVGISEPVFIIPAFVAALLRLRKRMERDKPDVAVLIGNDVFNVLLARWLRGRKVRTISYFPPQVWLWHSLLRPIAGSFDSILTSFPEEQVTYQRAGGSAMFVGHYLCDLLSPATGEARARARGKFGLLKDAKVVGLLPGSRTQEVSSLIAALLDAALDLLARNPSIRFILPVAEPRYKEIIQSEVQRRRLSDAVVISHDSHESMRACDLLLVASGTATLEAALLGLPMVILYRVSRVTLVAVKLLRMCRVMRYETVGLPNLLLGRMAVPELKQNQVTAQRIASTAWSILTDERRQRQMREDLKQIEALLGEKGSLKRAARCILSETGRATRLSPADGTQLYSYPAATSALTRRV